MNLRQNWYHIKKSLRHIVFWVLVWLFYVYFYSFKSGNNSYIFLFSLALIPITMGATYFVTCFLIPKYLVEKKYGKFILHALYSVVLAAYAIVFVMLAGYVYLTDLQIMEIPPLGWSLSYILLSVYLIVIVVAAFHLLKMNYESMEKFKDLQQKILETQLQVKEQELMYLKKQIHPHFLFNTLNTIYGFALNNSKETPELILKLSNLLDYILYQVTKPKVALYDEVEHIKEYISLEEVRFQDSLTVNFSCTPIAKRLEVAPMLLIPFVENAFKHGVLVKGMLSVDIDIKCDFDSFKFEIENNFLSEADDYNGAKGIGLDNFRKRLDLLYPDTYQLGIDAKGDKFCVSLSISHLNN